MKCSLSDYRLHFFFLPSFDFTFNLFQLPSPSLISHCRHVMPPHRNTLSVKLTRWHRAVSWVGGASAQKYSSALSHSWAQLTQLHWFMSSIFHQTPLAYPFCFLVKFYKATFKTPWGTISPPGHYHHFWANCFKMSAIYCTVSPRAKFSGSVNVDAYTPKGQEMKLF